MHIDDLQETMDGIFEMLTTLHQDALQTTAMLMTAAIAIKRHTPDTAADWAAEIDKLLQKPDHGLVKLDHIETIDAILRGLPLPPRH